MNKFDPKSTTTHECSDGFFQTIKTELEVKRPTMDRLCSMSQDLLSSVRNKEVASKLEARLENFAKRWDRLVQSLELSSTQVKPNTVNPSR